MMESMRNTIPWPGRADGRPLNIAHRGASSHANENTLHAFEVAAGLGADMWEIDIRLTGDGMPVVSHDSELKRLFGIDAAIANLTVAELKAAAPDLPSLEETIGLAERLGQALYIEIKDEGAGLAVAEVLQRTGFRRAGIGSFMAAEIRMLAEADCLYPLSILVRLGDDPFVEAEKANADIIHLCWEHGGERPQDLVTPSLIDTARARDLGIVLWHEERKAILDDLVKLPVLGICTNQPELMAVNPGARKTGITVVCHRGANRFAPENTLAAARLCLDQGFDCLELDVRETRDGEIIVIHDPTLERTTNGTGKVADHTLAGLRALDAGSWFDPFFAGQKIPTLKEMIALCQSYRRKMYIENKAVEPEKLVAEVRAMDFMSDCFFWSPNQALQERLRALAPEANIMARLVDYPDLAALTGHLASGIVLTPPIVEIEGCADYARHAEACLRAGMTPMLQYFGDNPAVFHEVVALRPQMLNLDRGDLLLAALQSRDGEGDA